MKKRTYLHRKTIAAASILAALMGGGVLAAHVSDSFALDVAPDQLGEAPEKGSAYISKASVLEITDGTAPWDANSTAAGNDNSPSNKRVRSFDTITYDVEYTVTPSKDASYSYYKNARVGFRVVIPFANSKQVEFPLGEMGWADDTEGYKPTVKVETINGVQSQVLTCYRRLEPTRRIPATVPGTATVSFPIAAKMLNNGTNIRPDIYVWVEGADNDQHQALYGNAYGKKITPNNVVVTAAPKYNVSVVKNIDSYARGVFDFASEGNSYAQNKSRGKVEGRLFGFSVMVALYNDRSDKGLKGIEIPQGGITFNVNLSSSLKIPKTPEYNTTNTYTPLLWGFDENEKNPTSRDGRAINKFGNSNCYNSRAVYNRLDAHSTTPNCSAYKGGTWTMTQSGAIVSCKVDGYEINPDHFPCRYPNDATAATTIYNPNNGQTSVGMFTSGNLWIVQPFVNLTTRQTVFQEYGSPWDASFVVNAAVSNFKAESVTKQATSTQMNTIDDTCAFSQNLRPPGNYDTYCVFTTASNVVGNMYGTDATSWSGNFSDGSDYATLGSKVRALWGLRSSPYDQDNCQVAENSLLKIDDKCLAYDPDGGGFGIWQAAARDHTTFYFACKRDGRGWTSDAEQKNATMEDLIYFSDYNTVVSKGYTCIGFLACERRAWDNDSPLHYADSRFTVPLKVTSNSNYAEKVTMCTVDDAYWTRLTVMNSAAAYLGKSTSALTVADYQKYVDAKFLRPNGNGGGLPSMPLAETARGHRGPHYTKAVYDSNGYAGAAEGGWHNGDSLFIVSEICRISKTVDQRVNGTAKRIYDMGYQQRVVDYCLNFAVNDSNGKVSASNTTITITDTLPASLTYIPYSSFYGGTYQENTPNAGTMINPQRAMEPTVTKNANGTTTLKWVLNNVDPRTLQNIHYSCRIGVEGHPTKDVKNNDQITSTATIGSTYDLRKQLATYGNVASNTIVISKLRSQSLSISGNPYYNEQNANLNFISYIGNYGNSNLVDAFGVNMMPYNGDPEGTHYNGDWSLTSMQLDKEFCTDLSDVTVYFTNDTKYRNMDSAEISWDEVISTWTKGTVNASTGAVTIPAGCNHPVAWAITDNLLAPKEVLAMKQTVKPTGNKCEDKYSMTLTDGDNVVDAALSVVTREIRGQAWVDWNLDDIKNDGDQGLAGVKVRLVNASGATVTNHDGNACETVTGEDGTYEFTKIPQGTYSVIFTRADGKNFIGYEGVIKDNPAAGDAHDNDADYTWVGEGQYETSQMKIPNLPFPSPADMYEVKYELNDYDAALKPLGRDLNLYKADMDDHNWKLPNTEFSLTGTSLAGFAVDASATSDDAGKLSFGFIPFGTYELKETKRAYQHLDAPATWSVTIAKNNVLTVTSDNAAMQDATRGIDDIRVLDEMMKPDIAIAKKVANKTTGENADNLQEDVTKSAHIGDVLEYEITITNTGNCDLSRIMLDDKMLVIFNLFVKGTLHAGESTTLTYEHTVTEDDAITKALENTARTWATPPDDLSQVSDEDTVLTNVTSNPSIHIVKSVDKDIITDAKPGDIVYYDFVVTNTGDVTLSKVQLPDWMTASGKVNPLYFPLMFFHPNGDPVMLSSQYTILQSDIDRGYIKNFVKATGVEPVDETTVESDISAVKTLLVQKPSISIVKTVDKASAYIGEDLHYTFTITNTGNVTLKDVRMSDELLKTSGYKVADALAPEQVITYSTWTTGYYTVVEEDAYGEHKVVNTADVKAIAPNGENVESEDEDIDVWGAPYNYVTDDDDAVTDILDRPALRITKSVDEEPAVEAEGDIVTWRFIVENTGDVTIENVHVIDDLLTMRAIGVTLDKTTLAPGEKAQGSARMQATQDDVDAGHIYNVAKAGGTSRATGAYVESNPDDAEIAIEAVPELSVEKDLDLTQAHIGDVIHYTLKVTNTGNVTLSDITLDDEVASVSGYHVADTLAPGESTEVYAEREVVEEDIVAGKIVNVAQVHGKAPAGDETDAESNEVETEILHTPAIKLAKTVNTKVVTPAQAGQMIVWTVAVTNEGDVSLHNVRIADPLLAGQYEGLDITGGELVLAPGETKTYDLEYNLTQEDVDNGNVVNTAMATGEDIAGNSVSDTDDESVVIARSNGIALTKSVDKSFIPNAEAGMLLTYDFVVTNTGNVTIKDIRIEDDIESVNARIDWSTKSGDSAGQVLAPGESVHASATYAITDQDIFNGQVDNTAVAYAKAPKNIVLNADDESGNEGDEGDEGNDENGSASGEGDGEEGYEEISSGDNAGGNSDANGNDGVDTDDGAPVEIESNEAEAITMLEIAPPLSSGVADIDKNKKPAEVVVAALGENAAGIAVAGVICAGAIGAIVIRRRARR